MHLSQRPSRAIAPALCALFLAVVVPMGLTSTPAVAKTSPSAVAMVGTWTGHRERFASADGYVNGSATLTVTKTSGLTFTGTMNVSLPSGDINAPSWARSLPVAR